MPRFAAKDIFVEGAMVVFGHDGFYEKPKGWGLDLCYFHKREFAWWRGRKPLMRRIERALAGEPGQMAVAFAGHLIKQLQHRILHEWHYDRADLMFQSAKTTVPSLARYADFPVFAQMVLAGRPFCTPEELEARMKEYLMTVQPGKDPLRQVEGQTYLLFGFLQRAMEQEMTELLGKRQGEALFRQLLEIAPNPPREARSLEEFMQALLLHPKALEMLTDWHMGYFARLKQRKKHIWKTLRRLQVEQGGGLQAKAMRAVRRESQSLPPELVRLMRHLDIPVFVATGGDLSFFRAFHQPGWLVYRQTGRMQQMTGMGLCVHRRNGQGAVFVTYRADALPRFRHTLLEECTHFADGPVDRIRLQGHDRYSGTPEFHAAFAADYALYAPWRNSKALGVREWGLVLTQLHYPARRIAALQKRIEAYSATLDFRHYAEEERMAEIFAALPIIERAIGRRAAHHVLPNMFAYYETHYRKGLQRETAEIGKHEEKA